MLNSGIKRHFLIDVRFKLIITIIFILFVVSTVKGNYLILLLYFCLALIFVFLFKPKLPVFLKRAFLVFLFPLSISIFIPFFNPGNILYQFNLGLFTVNITDTGLEIFLTTIIKSFLSLLILTALTASSSDLELLHGLRKIYFPKIIVSIIFLMYRYLFLIRDEARAGQLAINSRVFQKSYNTINKRLAFLAGNLFIKSFDRAENIYKSMESRGYDGNFYFLKDETDNKSSLVTGIVTIAVLVSVLTAIKCLELFSILK